MRICRRRSDVPAAGCTAAEQNYAVVVCCVVVDCALANSGTTRFREYVEEKVKRKDMETLIRTMKGADPETAEIAARIWKEGGLVAFPTETVYGLGGNGLDADASRKIYAAKARPSDNPLILHIADEEQLKELTPEITPMMRAAIDAFWPGPLTMIVPKTQIIPYETTGGLETVAIRMPSHPAAQCLLRAVQLPIAAPSANRSGRPSPTNASHVIEDMDGRIDMIIDGGDVGIGVESTIVDLTGKQPMLLRPGFITPQMLEQVLGSLAIDPAVYKQVSAAVHPKAPGMKYRHYAPKADMEIVEGSREAVAVYINQKLAAQPKKKIGILATDENVKLYQGGFCESVGSHDSLAEVAHNLFRVLRDFDDAGVDMIYSESFSSQGEGMAVMNRLMKAAGHHVVKV